MQLRLSLSGELPSPELAGRFAGVGLIRSEYLLRPHEEYVTLARCRERLTAYAAEVAARFAPRPVWYRMAELTTPEANTLRGVDEIITEADPMKGLRGLRRGLRRPDAFVLEAGAVAEAAADHPNLHLLLPYVGDAEEFARGTDLVARAGWPNRIGTMVEIPAAVLDAERLVAAGASNLMLGLNDLTSLLTGAARASGFDDKMHPAVWWAVERVRAAAAAGGCEWGLAGNLTKSVLAEAARVGVPYATVHYCELPALLDVPPGELPDRHFVALTKIKTRSQIAAAELRRTLTALDLPVGW